MPSEPPPLETLALVCPHCDGAFQVRSEYRGTQVACPHCQQAIEVPRTSAAVPPPPPAPIPSAERVSGVESASPQRASVVASPAGSTPVTPLEVPAPPKPEPPRELTREERDRLRRRFRVTVAVFAAIVLAIALSLLLQVE